MKTKVSVIYYFTILIVVLFVLSLLFTLLVISSNTISHNQMINDKEGFTNKIRETYRPYFRNLRLGTNNYYNKMKNRFLSFFRKLGLF